MHPNAPAFTVVLDKYIIADRPLTEEEWIRERAPRSLT
jgi:hypothetical protein